MEKVECRNCKGKGHILDSNPFMWFNPFMIIAAVSEKNDKNGSTRRECDSCKGKGFIIWN